MLTFLSALRGKVLATAFVNIEGCEQVFFTIGSQRITNDTRTWDARGVAAFGTPFTGHTFAASVLKAAGSTWNLAVYRY